MRCHEVRWPLPTAGRHGRGRSTDRSRAPARSAGLCGIKCLENAIDMRRIDARPGIAHGHENACAVRLGTDQQLSWSRLDRAHCFNRVQDKVQGDLLQLNAIPLNGQFNRKPGLDVPIRLLPSSSPLRVAGQNTRRVGDSPLRRHRSGPRSQRTGQAVQQTRSNGPEPCFSGILHYKIQRHGDRVWLKISWQDDK
jgi:hypothetical protein